MVSTPMWPEGSAKVVRRIWQTWASPQWLLLSSQSPLCQLPDCARPRRDTLRCECGRATPRTTMAVKQTMNRANRRMARTSLVGYADGCIAVPLVAIGGPDQVEESTPCAADGGWAGLGNQGLRRGVAGGGRVQKGEKCSGVDRKNRAQGTMYRVQAHGLTSMVMDTKFAMELRPARISVCVPRTLRGGRRGNGCR